MLISIQCFNNDRTITEINLNLNVKAVSKFNGRDLLELRKAIDECLDDRIRTVRKDYNNEARANARRPVE